MILYQGLLAICACVPLAVDDESAVARTATIEERVIEAIARTVPCPHLPIYREFVQATLKAMPKLRLPDEVQEHVLAESIASYILETPEFRNGMKPSQLREHLTSFAEAHKDNLAAVTPAMLQTKWAPVREGILHDAGTINALIKSFFDERPVVILDWRLNKKIAENAGGLPATAPAVVATRPTSPAAAREARARRTRELLFEHIDRLTKRAIAEAADYVSSVYLMNELRWAGPLKEADTARIKRYLHAAFVHDGTILIASSFELGRAVKAARSVVFGKDMPAPPAADERKAKILFGFRFLSGTMGLSEEVPATFGRAVPVNVRTGKAFGFTGLERARRYEESPQERQQRLRRHRLDQRSNTWFSGIMRLADTKMDAARVDLCLRYLSRWRENVYSLQGFFGSKTVGDLEWSKLDRQLLELFMHELKHNRLFKDDEMSGRERDQLIYEYLLAPSANVPPAYRELAAELRAWLAKEYQAKITPEQSHRYALRHRMSRVLDDLMFEVSLRQGTHPGQKAYQATHRAVWRIQKGLQYRFRDQVHFLEKKLTRKEFGKLSPLEGAIYAFVQASLESNPVLKNVQATVPSQTLWEQYRQHVRTTASPEEKRAHREAIEALVRAQDGAAGGARSRPSGAKLERH